MAEKKIKIGDPVLFYGINLEVVEFIDRDGTTLAKVAEVEKRAIREQAIEEIRSLREGQAELSGADHSEVHDRIEELDRIASENLIQANLRLDLLDWWPERKVWVSDGRILSDEQVDQFRKLTGSRPRPDAQRQALKVIETMGAE